MERASSYSTGGGSGANSDNEALSASLQNSTRLEITTQVGERALSSRLPNGVGASGVHTCVHLFVLAPLGHYTPSGLTLRTSGGMAPVSM